MAAVKDATIATVNFKLHVEEALKLFE